MLSTFISRAAEHTYPEFVSNRKEMRDVSRDRARHQRIGTGQAVGLNHVALRVTDLGRSIKFYKQHLGLVVRREHSSNAFLSCGGNNFLALFRANEAGLDHFCFTIPDYDASSTVKRLNAAGLDNERHDDRVYFEDPDSIALQLSGEWDDYPGGRPD